MGLIKTNSGGGALLLENEELKNIVEVSKMGFGEKATSDSYYLPDSLKQSEYVSSQLTNPNYKGYPVLKHFTLIGVGFPTSSSNTVHMTVYGTSHPQGYTYYFYQGGPQLQEIDLVVGDSIIFGASQSYGGAAAASYAYQIIPSV